MSQSVWTSLKPLSPLIILGISAMILLIVGVFQKKFAEDLVSKIAQWIVAPIVIFLYIVMDFSGVEISFEGLAVSNFYTQLISVILLLGMIVMLDIHRTYMQVDALNRFEYPILILFSTLGMLVMVSAGSLITLYLGLEILSLSLYVMVAFCRDKGREGEAAIKYFVLGALSSTLFLFGASYIYGFVGSSIFETIALGFKAEPVIPVVIYFGVALIIVGMAFKIAAVPFHMWAPDVYEGSPMIVTAYLATLPKLAAFAIIIRLLVGVFFPLIDTWRVIIIILSILSMLIGTYGALYQTNIKRFLAYSSIAHMGYALTGIVAGTPESVDSVLIYNVLYFIMLIATFFCLLHLRRQDQLVIKINELAGLSKGHPFIAACLGVLLFSLAGIPPMAGFFAKFSVFRAAVMGGYYPLAIIGVLTSVVGAVYYLRIVKIMYFDEAFGGEVNMRFDRTLKMVSRLAIGFGVLVSLFFMAYPQALIKPLETASRSLFLG